MSKMTANQRKVLQIIADGYPVQAERLWGGDYRYTQNDEKVHATTLQSLRDRGYVDRYVIANHVFANSEFRITQKGRDALADG